MTLKDKIRKTPFVCTYPWVIGWVQKDLKLLKDNSVFVEIGTFVGGSTVEFAKANPNVIIHSIDPNNFSNFENEQMFLDLKKFVDDPNLTCDNILEIQKLHVEDYSNIVLHTGTVSSINIPNISMAFIDGSHTYNDVILDLMYVWDRMEDGGIIFGDDADTSNIYKAVVDFCQLKDVEFTLYSKAFKIIKNSQSMIGEHRKNIEGNLYQ